MAKQTLTKPEESERVIVLTDGRRLSFGRPLVMGVLNVTPDSFSDGGRYDSPEAALRQAVAMVEQGADIVDVGGESSRPGAQPVDPTEERHRVLPVIAQLRKESRVFISVDTYRAETAAAALDAGADLVNDISALRFDRDMARLVAERAVPIVLMHMKGTPRNMQQNPVYTDCVKEIAEFFDERIEFAAARGIDRNRLILDPGIGFGKRLEDNLDILSRLREFRRFGLPVMVGASRKSFIGMLAPSGAAASERIGGSIAAAVLAMCHGADIVRVHDVAPTVEALKTLVAIRTRGVLSC